MRSLVAAAIVAGVIAQPAHSQSATRLLYTSDWAGADAAYAVDPAGGKVRQLVRPHDQTCSSWPPCGVGRAWVSPDAKWVAYVEHAPLSARLYLRRRAGGPLRLVATGNGISLYGWSANSRRIAYSVTTRGLPPPYTEKTQLFTFEVRGFRARLVDGALGTSASDARWSPRGTGLAYLRSVPGTIRKQLVVAPNVLAEAPLHRDQYAWSPDGTTIAYCYGGVRLVRRNASSTSTLSSRCIARLEWSPDSRFLAVRADGVDVIDTQSGSTRTLEARWDVDFEWAPRRSQLALGLPDGLQLYNTATGTTSFVTPDHAAGIVWSPRGDALAYVVRRHALVWDASDLRVADLNGSSHTVVQAAGTAGGSIAYLTWTPWPRTAALRQPAPRFVGRATPTELTAPWVITRLESDGERVAYVVCNHVFVWSPGSSAIRQAEPAASLMPRCSTPGPPQYVISYEIFDVGIAGDAVVYGEAFGCLGGAWSFTALTLTAPEDASELHRGSGSRCGASFDVNFGEAVGSDSLLVYSTWRGNVKSASPREEKITEYQDIRRVGGGVIAAREGTLVPLDVDGGRIAVSRGTTFAMLDETGRELWSVAVAPRAAVFTGDELVLIHAGEALRYVAATGAFLGSLPLQVGWAVGRPCQTPHWQWCDFGGVTIHDGANGLVAYEVSGRVRVLRVSDGRDRDVAAGRLAEFTSQGLVVADGARLRLTPFAELR